MYCNQKEVQVILVLIFAQNVNGKILNETSECYTMSNDYWNLIQWFYGKTNQIFVTFIADAPGKKQHLWMQDEILSELFRRKRYVVTYSVMHQNFEEKRITYADTFTWEGKPFETRPNQSETAFTRKKRSVVHPDDEHLSMRKEETDMGTLIIADSISVINRYLEGPARRPFIHPRSLYVILISDAMESTCGKESQNVMVKLWKHYGIADAILIAPCSGSPKTIGTYFPFQRADRSDSPHWGEFKCLNLLETDFQGDSFFRKFENLNEYPLKVSMFPRYPTALMPEEIPDVFFSSYFMNVFNDSRGYGGIDGILLGNIARSLNFSAIIVTPNGSDFGYRLSSGIFIGSIGDVLYRNSFVSFNGRFMSDYGTDEIEYMFPYYFDKLCIIAPKALKIPEWMAIFKCFHVSVWVVFLLVNSVCGWFWYLLRRSIIAHENTDKNAKQKAVKLTRNKFSMVFIEMWVIMLSGPMTHVPTHIKERIFLASCLLANLIFAGSFQGSLTRSFSTVSYYKDIDTLAELDKSGLPIATSSGSLRNIFQGMDSSNAVIRSLSAKYTLRNSTIPIRTRTANDRDICSVERLSDIGLIIATQYEMSDGSVLLHVIKDCPRSYYMSYIVKKGWPLLPTFGNRIRSLFEGGLLQEWYDQVENAIIVQRRFHLQKKSENAKAFTLIDMQTAFYILGIGLAGCILVFLGELYVHRRRNMKKGVAISKICRGLQKNK